MTALRLAILISALGMLAAAAPAQTAGAPAAPSPGERAAATDAAADRLAEAQARGVMPELADVMNVVDKVATPPSPEEQTPDWSAPVRLAVVFTLLALLPSLLVMVTSFTRVVIVLAFVRRALTTQNIPPTIAIIGLGLFLTLFIMAPVLSQANTEAIQPYLADEINLPAAITRGEKVLKEFMVRQTRVSDMELFVGLSGIETPETLEELPSYVVVPAFAISEFRTAFEMGALLFIPFLLIDLVIASVLLSTGMMMLPPAMVSLPFKIILFILVDGWRLLAETLVNSFQWGLT